MKKLFTAPKHLFTLLVISSLLAIAAGVYLGMTLGMHVQDTVTILAAIGMLAWVWAWGEFLAMCLRLRRGESAFTQATGRTLRMIGWCMVTLAAVTVSSAYSAGTREAGFLLIEAVLLPGFFLAVAVAAKILRSLLEHAMELEERQEGVI